MSLGVGKYKVEVCHAGVGDERGNVILDVTPWVSSIRWAWTKGISNAQVTVTSHECGERLARRCPTVLSELRVTRSGTIVHEGVLTRKESTDQTVRLVGSNLLWWLQRRFLSGKTKLREADLADVVTAIFADSVGRTDLYATTMDPGIGSFVTVNQVGETGTLDVDELDYRMAYEELTAAARSGMDFSMVRRSTLVVPEAREDPDPLAGFGTIPRAQIIGLPKVTERGDLYLTDFVAIGADGITTAWATVEDVHPGATVAPHLRAQGREFFPRISDLTELQARADSEIRRRFPSPVEVSMGSTAWLSPDCPVTMDRLVPTAEGVIEPGAGYPPQSVRLTKVEGRVDSDGAEKISVDTEPVITLAP